LVEYPAYGRQRPGANPAGSPIHSFWNQVSAEAWRNNESPRHRSQAPKQGWSDRQARDVLPPGENELKEGPRDKGRRKQVRNQPDGERHRKPANRARADLKQEGRGNERRNVRVEQRQEDATEGGLDRRPNTASSFELFLDAFEDQHIRIHTGPHRQNQTSDSRQRHHGTHIRHQTDED